MNWLLLILTTSLMLVQPGFCSKVSLFKAIIQEASKKSSHYVNHTSHNGIEHYAASKAAIATNKISKQDWEQDSVKYKLIFLDTNRFIIKVDSSGNRLIIPANYHSNIGGKKNQKNNEKRYINKINDEIRSLDSVKIERYLRTSNQAPKEEKNIKSTSESHKYENDPNWLLTMAPFILGIICILVFPALLNFKKNKRK